MNNGLILNTGVTPNGVPLAIDDVSIVKIDTNEPTSRIPLSIGELSSVEMTAGISGSVGTTDYESLRHKPAINGEVLVGDKAITRFLQFGSELTYINKTLDVDVMTAQQIANLLTDD